MFQFEPIEAWWKSIFYANVKLSMQPMMMDSLLLHIRDWFKKKIASRVSLSAARNTIYDDEQNTSCFSCLMLMRR